LKVKPLLIESPKVILRLADRFVYVVTDDPMIAVALNESRNIWTLELYNMQGAVCTDERDIVLIEISHIPAVGHSCVFPAEEPVVVADGRLHLRLIGPGRFGKPLKMGDHLPTLSDDGCFCGR
jgi:hypothetical protein